MMLTFILPFKIIRNAVKNIKLKVVNFNISAKKLPVCYRLFDKICVPLHMDYQPFAHNVTVRRILT